MGAYCSKSTTGDVTASAAQPSAPNGLTTSTSATYVSSYLSTYPSDPDLQVFDTALQEQTRQVISTFSGEPEVNSLSLETLRAITGCYSDVNHEVVKYVLASKKDVWKNPELLDLVQQYFDYSDQVLDFFNTLDRCLKGVKNRQLFIDMALHFFEEETKSGNDVGIDSSLRYAQTLEELRNFKDANDPFGDEFGAMLQSVQKQQELMLAKLEASQRKLNKKLKSINTYKKASYVIFAACLIGVIVLSIVAAALAAPPVVTALAGALSAPMGGMGKWMYSFWKKYEDEVKPQIELVTSLELTTFRTVRELESMKRLVNRLEIEVKALQMNAGLTTSDGSMVVVVIEDVKKKLSGFSMAMNQLEENASKYNRDIRKARTVILQGISRRGTVIS